jgi:hypothetical protein
LGISFEWIDDEQPCIPHRLPEMATMAGGTACPTTDNQGLAGIEPAKDFFSTILLI